MDIMLHLDDMNAVSEQKLTITTSLMTDVVTHFIISADLYLEPYVPSYYILDSLS